ncbi:MAG: hypothetical protein NC218_01720 [Acetobacter sp.]|nr:hypothetical protein [Acetobacter sp.]
MKGNKTSQFGAVDCEGITSGQIQCTSLLSMTSISCGTSLTVADDILLTGGGEKQGKGF